MLAPVSHLFLNKALPVAGNLWHIADTLSQRICYLLYTAELPPVAGNL